MAENVLYMCMLCMVSCVCQGFNSDHNDSEWSKWLVDNSVALGVVSLLVLLLLSVFLVTLCGGCTDMEVGSENHPASCGAGGHKQNYGGNMVTDANTGVLSSFHTLPDQSNSLPYSLNPVSGPQGFTGYDTTGYTGQQQPQRQNAYAAQPYGSPGVQSPTGYGAQCVASAPPPTTEAHRPAVEPPPPSYNESVHPHYGGGWR